MSEIRFFITEQAVNDMEAVEYEALERAQDGEIKLYRLRPLICRFMVDENNKPVPHAVAMKQSERMKIREVRDFVNKFFAAMQERAVPNGKGTPSESPTEAARVDSPSLVG